MFRTIAAPVYSLDTSLLRKAGFFRSPEAEGDGGSPDPAGGDDGEGGEGGKRSDPVSRISTLVEERNAARSQAEKYKSELKQLREEVEQLKSNDQSKIISDLRAQLKSAQEATATRFDKLLETELANLPEAAQKAVKAIPGGSEAQFDWLVANRAILQPSNGNEPAKPPPGPSNDRKPSDSGNAGVSSVVKAAVEARKAAKPAGFPGLTG